MKRKPSVSGASLRADVLTLPRLSVRFGEKQVLSDVTITLRRGRITVLQGESGSGKTTLLSLLAGYGGQRRVLPPELTVSVMFQEDRLFESLTAGENLRLVSRATMTPAESAALLARVGLSGADGLPVRELSGGMKRRVALARAVAFGGDVLLLDEPLNGVDEKNAALCLSLIRSYAERGRFVLVVSHDPALPSRLDADVVRLG